MTDKSQQHSGALNDDGAARDESNAPEVSGNPSKETLETTEPGRMSIWRVTVIATFMELCSTILVLNQAIRSEHMPDVTFLFAHALNVLTLWIYHAGYSIKHGPTDAKNKKQKGSCLGAILQWITFLAKLCFSSLLIVVLWDLNEPHKIWTGAGFITSKPALELKVAIVLNVLSLLGLVAHMLYLGRGERTIVDDASSSSWFGRLLKRRTRR